MNDAIAADANAIRAVQAFNSEVLRVVGGATLVIPSVVFAESVGGWHLLMERYKRKQDEVRIAMALNHLCEFQEFVRDLEILRYTTGAQAIFSSLRHGRGNRGQDDLRIAAICLEHDVPLLTRNVRDFDDIPNLKLITW